MKLCCTAVLLVLLVGCGPASRVVRLDTGRGDTLVFTPRTGAEPVVLDEDAFEEAVAKLARDARPPARPQEAARLLPDNSGIRYYLAQSYYGLKDYKNAIPAFQEAVRLNPKNATSE